MDLGYFQHIRPQNEIISMSICFSTMSENFQAACNIKLPSLGVEEETADEGSTAAKMPSWQMRAKVFLGMTFSKWF